MPPKELDMSAAENCVCFNLRWVTRAVTQFYDAEMRRHGIRSTQGSILASLNSKNSWSMAELSDWLGMDRTTLVRNLRPLQRDGLVKIAGGGRGNRVELTITSWVLITGASSGFGEEFARQYAERGHSLVLVARRLDRLQSLAASLHQQFRIDVVVEQVDLSDVAAIIQLHQALREREIAIDILINNAGHGLQGPFLDGQLDAALAMVQLDIASLTAITHIFGQEMRKRRRGRILLVASLLAYQGVEGFAVYSAAKAYVLRLG